MFYKNPYAKKDKPGKDSSFDVYNILIISTFIILICIFLFSFVF